MPMTRLCFSSSNFKKLFDFSSTESATRGFIRRSSQTCTNTCVFVCVSLFADLPSSVLIDSTNQQSAVSSRRTNTVRHPHRLIWSMKTQYGAQWESINNKKHMAGGVSHRQVCVRVCTRYVLCTYKLIYILCIQSAGLWRHWADGYLMSPQFIQTGELRRVRRRPWACVLLFLRRAQSQCL